MAFATKEEILEIIEEIRQSPAIILVEGKKDKAALEQLGIKNVTILNGKDIWNRCEEIAAENKEVIILMDFDVKGKELFNKINSNLTKLGTKINKDFSSFFRKRTRVSHIQGLDTYIKNLEPKD